MDYQSIYKSKFTTVEGALARIKSNDMIYSICATGEPLTFIRNLHTLKGKVHNLTFNLNLAMENAEVYRDEEYRDLVNVQATFFPRIYSPLQKIGRSNYIPAQLRNMGNDPLYYHRRLAKPINVFVLAVSPMDKHGYFTSGSMAGFTRDIVEFADLVILEVNESVPRTFGDTYIHVTEADVIYNSADNKILYMPVKETDESDKKIGKYIAELINDGDTIQLGIGGIPTAAAVELEHKRDLGIHTEMLNDGLVYLCNAGAITNRKKNFFPNKIVTSFSMGSKTTYDFIDENINVLHLDVAFTNSPAVFSKNDNMISVNTALSVDLMGQCASEAIGTNQISGVGGQTETAVGAKESKGGKSIIALHSTANVKTKDGTRQRISSITAVHPAGTVISLSRNDVDFVVTEYGMAALRGATLKERAKALINIAHPDYRDQLTEEAKRYYLI